MNVKRLLLLMILPALLLQLSAQAQQRTVTGKVTDSRNGTALQSVSVTVKGSSVGTQTAADGSFSLKVPSGATTLMISSIGYANREVKISDGAVNVALEPIDKALGDVIVIAYGTRKKSDLTSSVTAISAKDFQKGSIASSEQLLQGKVAGLEITSGGGAAGGGSRIRIRGGASLNASNDPLIVIDGIAVDGNGVAGSANLLNTINPNDIESISVLKDASATALYGSRASNGVLIITTKKGAKGKVRYNFNTQLSSGSVAKTVGVLSGDEIRSIINADAAASGDNTYKKLLELGT